LVHRGLGDPPWLKKKLGHKEHNEAQRLQSEHHEIKV